MRYFLLRAQSRVVGWYENYQGIFVFILVCFNAFLNYFLGIWACIFFAVILIFINKECAFIVLIPSLLLGAYSSS